MTDTRPTILVHPTVEPVTVDEAIFHLNLTPDSNPPSADDVSRRAKLTKLIRAAREYCENRLGCAFYLQTLRAPFDGWSLYGFELPRATPLVSIVDVTYRLWTGVKQTLDPTVYFADTDTMPGTFQWAGRYAQPLGPLAVSSPIQITYICGKDPFDSPPPVLPEMLSVAMLMLVADWYMNREAEFVASPAAVTSSEVIFGVNNILDRMKYQEAF